jgi:hypothetical protein
VRFITNAERTGSGVRRAGSAWLDAESLGTFSARGMGQSVCTVAWTNVLGGSSEPSVKNVYSAKPDARLCEVAEASAALESGVQLDGLPL